MFSEGPPEAVRVAVPVLPLSQQAVMAAQAEGAPGGPEPWLGSGFISKVERTGSGDRSNVGVGAEWRVVLGASRALGVVICEERDACGRGGSWTSHPELG